MTKGDGDNINIKDGNNYTLEKKEEDTCLVIILYLTRIRILSIC